jgi:hypothetical protein
MHINASVNEYIDIVSMNIHIFSVYLAFTENKPINVESVGLRTRGGKDIHL